jgi:hypothetical protein
MRSIRYIFLLMTIGILFLAACPHSGAGDYDSRFVRNYPPGYHGTWYYAERFWKPQTGEQESPERSRWDRFMARLTDITNWPNGHIGYPFNPIPYEWDYGTGRTFNLPNYNSNDWN